MHNKLQNIIEKKELTLNDLAKEIDELSRKIAASNERFSNYQQATQWVVQMAFALIASVTIGLTLTSLK